jgi:EmrB/QacA subfamily drug resistance transporter
MSASRSTEWKVILVAIAGTFMVILDQTIVNVALPHIMAIFNETADRAQLVISAYLMATAISTPAAAFLSTRFGMKRVYLLAQAGFLTGSVLCGMAWNANMLILFRILQGLSGGLLSPLAMTFLFTSVPPEERGSAMAIFGIPMMLGPAIGPTLGGYLVTDWTWRMCFYVNVPVVILAIFIGLSWLDDTPQFPVTFDYKGFLLAAIGFSSLLFGLSYAPTWGWGDERVLGLFMIGIVGIAAWIILELRTKLPMLNLRIFSYGGYTLATGINFVTTIGLFSAVFLLPLFLQNLRGLSALNSGLILLWGALGPVITMPISGRLYDTIGPRVPVVLGLLITGVTTFWFRGLDIDTSYSTLRLVLFLRGMGMGLCMMPVMTYALSSVPIQMTAQASSLTNVTRTVFASLGIAVFGSLLAHFQQTNLATLVQTVTPESVGALRVLSIIQVAAVQYGFTVEAARQIGTWVLYELANLRASIMAFDSDYFISAVIVLVGILPALFLPHGRLGKAAAVDAVSLG